MNSVSCPFCRIAVGELPARMIYQDDELLAFQDSHPIAPVHILIVPREHITSVNDIQPEHAQVLGRMLLRARHLASDSGIALSGYRLVMNTGPDAGQTVPHLHLHLIGGRHLPFRFDD